MGEGARGALHAGGGPGRSRGGQPVRARAALRCPALLARVGSRYPRRHYNRFSRHIQRAEKSELLLAAEVEKRAPLSHDLETAKTEIQALQDRSPVSPITVKSTGAFYNCPVQSSRPTSKHIATEPWPTSALDFAKDTTGFVAIPQPPWPTLSCDTGPSALAAAGYRCVRIRQDLTERSAIQRYGRARAQEPLRFQ